MTLQQAVIEVAAEMLCVEPAEVNEATRLDCLDSLDFIEIEVRLSDHGVPAQIERRYLTVADLLEACRQMVTVR